MADTHKGGDFFCCPIPKIYCPENFTDDHRQFFEVADKFNRTEIEPLVEDIDHKKPGVLQSLMQQAAELGLFMVEIPEAYGGLGLDKVTGMLVSEGIASVGSFAVTSGAHMGIGTLPLVYYGTHEQKQKYLGKLGSGEWIGAYCLSEQGSGSDALAAKTTAVLSGDGTHYVLNGTKAWVTNGGFANIYTVFAQVIDGDEKKFSAFLVERTLDGISIGKEERKMGIRGSSTTLLMLDDVKVPVGNLLGEVGRGHKIAFNILNIGRWKLGAGSFGAAKAALREGVTYAQQRKQFKKPIATFGLIREKIAQSATLIYAGECITFRTAGLIDAPTKELNKDADTYFQDAIGVIDEFTIEASILKVFGSEVVSWVADQMLQVHGGNGFTEDYPLERMVRDARIMRIFEGTNEINRLIIPATLFKRTLQGRIPLMQFTQDVIAELAKPDTLPQPDDDALANERCATERVRRAIVYGASYAAQKYLAELKHKQRILGTIADAAIQLYTMESAVARAKAAIDTNHPDAELHGAFASLYCFEARANAFQILRRCAMLMAQGEELDALYQNLGKLDRRFRVDVMGLQEKVADACLAQGGYPLPY